MDKPIKKLFGTWIERNSKNLKYCSKESINYSNCVTLKGLNIKHFECDKEFKSLAVCLSTKKHV